MWDEFGFSQNPYDHLPVSASAAGERLLVGRGSEIDQLINRIKGRNAIPTLEGDIGVGKTSIIAVASYKMEANFFKYGGNCYLSLEKPFQLDASEDVEKFTERVFQDILVKVHHSQPRLIERGVNVGDTNKLYNWLTSVQYTGGGFTIGPAGGSISTTPNPTSGFSTLGFQHGVLNILKGMFPNPKKGGVICVIDNLELLEKSSTARKMVESMRDKVLTTHGLIWVICGARGIVRGLASSPRLQSHLSKPIQISPLRRDQVVGLVDRRVAEYKISTCCANVPVEGDGFLHIFKICNDNLRVALKFCSDFAEWIYENGELKSTSAEKYSLLEAWLAEEADDFSRSTRLTPRPWEIFDQIIDQGGSIAPSDHDNFGYDTPMAMRPQIKSLEEAGLVESTIDDSDQRRRTISVTPKGWLINYSRRGYPESK
jgi:hypothetical protein